MNFTTIIFLYFFLPAFMLVYFLTKPAGRALVLLGGTCVVIAWSEPLGLLPFFGSAVCAYLCAILCYNFREDKKRGRFFLALNTVVNVLLMALFFYSAGVRLFGRELFTALGCGVFSLHAISYCADVYRGEAEPEQSFIRTAAYIGFLPSLNGIPVVRRADVAEALKAPRLDTSMMADGIVVLLFGIAQKVLIADRLTALFEDMLYITGGEMSLVLSWMGAFIFGGAMLCRLKGYANIARGFAMMLGFGLGRSFDYPFSKLSLRDYLNSYNIPLVGWAHKYIYEPVAGSERSYTRMLIGSAASIILVCLSYDPSLKYLLWGSAAALLILFEMLFEQRYMKVPKPIRYIVTHVLTLIGWGLISQPELVSSMEYVSNMFYGATLLDYAPLLYVLRTSAPYVLLLVLTELPQPLRLYERLESRKLSITAMIKPVVIFALLSLCTAFIMAEV
ncbi:MAG: hypothetical protein IJ746_02775 [Ruminococcus sp.]|nr:hypothetical protein [Ruminococcus sp.]